MLRAEVSRLREKEKTSCPPHLPHMGQILRSFSEPGARRPRSALTDRTPRHPLCRDNEIDELEGKSDVARDSLKRAVVGAAA